MLKNKRAVSSYSTNDIKKTKDFYINVLGLHATEEMDGDLLDVSLGNDEILWIYIKPDHRPATFTVLNLLVDDINETIDEYTKKGVRFEKYEGEMKTDEKGIFHGNGFKVAWFKDPAENILSIIEDKT